MNVYWVSFMAYYPKFGDYITRCTVFSESEEGILQALRNKFKGKGVRIEEVIYSNPLGTEDEFNLDLFYQKYPNKYLDSWVPDITTKEIITDIIKKHPFEGKIYFKRKGE